MVVVNAGTSIETFSAGYAYKGNSRYKNIRMFLINIRVYFIFLININLTPFHPFFLKVQNIKYYINHKIYAKPI
jgi:hypothetical protein